MKKRNSQHSFAFVLLAGMLCFLVSGCRDLKKENKPESQSTAYASSSIFLAEPKSVQYPMEEATMQLSVMIPQEGEKCEKQSVYRRIEEKTGVSLSYQIVPQAEYSDAVLTMLDSQNIPDLIYGIPDEMLQAQLDPDTSEPLLILNAYIKTDAPNYIQAVQQNPERQHRAVGEDGNILTFLTFYDTPYRFADAGPVIRSDLLERYGIEAPETYDEWTDTLKALKNDVQAPLLLTTVEFRYWDYLSAGMGISMALDTGALGFYQVDGEVKYGPLEENFTKFVTLLYQWNQDGLLSKRLLDFPNMGSSDYLLKQANGESGIFFLDSSLIESVNVLSEIDGFSLTLLQDPVMEHGDVSHLAENREKTIYGNGFSVSAYCKSPEQAVRFIDYLYSEECVQLANYGVLQDTYTMQNGKPKYTEAVYSDPGSLAGNTSQCFTGIIAVDRVNLEVDSRILDASNAWLTNKDSQYMLPEPLAEPAMMEGEIRDYIFDLSTYAQTVTLELIAGDCLLSSIPDVQEKMRSLGADQCIELLQEELDAFLSR